LKWARIASCFSADYRFEEIGEATAWFDHASISETDREKIGSSNARALFKLNGA
jgi:gamma-resorcylate decarboxylase